METVGKWILAVGSAAASYFFGGWSGVLGALLVFVILDYLTGIAAAGMSGTLKSNTGLFDIARKGLIFAMVAVGHLVDGILGDGHMFRDAIAFFYIANELLSITENAGKMGLSVPDVIQRAIDVLKGKSGGNDKDKELVRMQARKQGNAQGIDVSHHNGSIDFKRVAADGGISLRG
ncbi:phage holin family protein [Paenibacillus silvae]|uniref:phage holin family protein n=1 Tax=Paenibacillus silvae TaxID=1325358 RepID=UPI0026D10D53